MAKIDRLLVYNKCNGRCGYCGKEISIKEMQVDHMQPHWHTMSEQECISFGIVKGSNDISNLMPSCRRCNKWKTTHSVEQFKKEISLQLERLHKYNPNYRIAKDYGLIQETPKEIVFYFETILNQ